MHHNFLVVTVKKGLKSVYIYRSYYKNKLGGPFFGPPCILNTETIGLQADIQEVLSAASLRRLTEASKVDGAKSVTDSSLSTIQYIGGVQESSHSAIHCACHFRRP